MWVQGATERGPGQICALGARGSEEQREGHGRKSRKAAPLVVQGHGRKGAVGTKTIKAINQTDLGEPIQWGKEDRNGD